MSGVSAHALGHLVKRTAGLVVDPVDSPDDARRLLEAQLMQAAKNIQPWQFALLFGTMVTFLLVWSSLTYTLGDVVATLTMIEQPRTALLLDEATTNELNSDKPTAQDEELVMIREVAVTSSIRGTMRHLKSVGGRTARWRGLSAAIVYQLCQALLTGALANIIGHIIAFFSTSGSSYPHLAVFLASLQSTLCLARLHMTWTHIVITQPSPLPWYRRIPCGRTYQKVLLLPTFIRALAEYLTVAIPMLYLASFKPAQDQIKDHKLVLGMLALHLIGTLGVATFVGIAIYIPASVTLARVEASLLPDDAETIVNFDRTLGGAAASLVGFGTIDLRKLYDAAWRSFDRASRSRLVKFYIKYTFIMLAIALVFPLVIFAELVLF